ncbi:MAG: hypothetical protein HYW63_05195, partial [Candidatus Levybacteria bacterium]|nr:hypothetical protein [Candidatus Levybacteria bacterium]
QCGSFTDGCGNVRNCGSCPGTQVCSSGRCEQNYGCTDNGACVEKQCQVGNIANCFSGSQCGGNCTGPIAGQVLLPSGNPYTDGARVVRKNDDASTWNQSNSDLTNAQGNYRFNNLPAFGPRSIQDIRLSRTGDDFTFSDGNKIDSCVYVPNSSDNTPWVKENIKVPNTNVNFRLNWREYSISGRLFWDPDGSGGGSDIESYIPPTGKSVRIRIRDAQGNVVGSDLTNTSNGRYSVGGLSTNINHNKAYTVSVDTVGSDGIRSGHRVVGGNSKSVRLGCGDLQGQHFYITSVPAGSTYFIQGGVFIDDDNDGISEPTDGNGRKDPGENYTSGTVNISGVGNFSSSPGTGFTTPQTLVEGSYTVTYSGPPAGYRATFPSISPYSLTFNLGPTCASVGGDTNCSAGSMQGVNFGIREEPVASWFQSVGGDVRLDRDSLKNVVPPGTVDVCSPSTQPFVSSEQDTKLSAGVVFTGTSPIFSDTGAHPRTKANIKLWLDTLSPFTPSRAGTIKTSYPYVKSIIEKSRQPIKPMFSPTDTTRACNEGSGTNCTLKGDLAPGNYRNTGNVTLIGGAYTFPTTTPGGDYIFLIDGNLTIARNIVVPAGITAYFIVSGNITVAPTVTRIEGIYSADGNFIFAKASSGLDSALTIEGNIIANAGLSNKNIDRKRDLGEDLNKQCPAVKVIYRPDFVLNSPELIRFSNYIIQEVAPRGN